MSWRRLNHFTDTLQICAFRIEENERNKVLNLGKTSQVFKA
jgi:hypothetical protein